MDTETPYTVKEVAEKMHLSRRIVADLFAREKGVIIYERPNPRRKRRSYRTIRIPRHVYERVLRRYAVQ